MSDNTKWRVRNRAQIDGRSVTIGSETVTVLLQDSSGNVVYATGTTVPTADTAGYAKGALFVKSDVADGTKGLYENQGTTDDSDFNLVGAITSAEIADNSITNAKMADDAVDTAEIVADAVTTPKIIDDAITTAKIIDEAVTPAKTSSVLILADLGTPSLPVTDRFLTSVAMQATAYTLDNTTLPTTEVARNVTITHALGDTADTLGDAVVTGTNIDDEVITETITISSGATAAGAKAFKTVTEVVTAGWVIDGVEGTADTISVGFGDIIGLPKVFADSADVWSDRLGGAWVFGTVAVDATNVEANTIDMSGGTYDGSKQATVAYVY